MIPFYDPPPNDSKTATGRAAYDFKEEIEKPKRQIEHDKQKKIYDDFNKTGGKYSRIKRKRVTRKGMRKTRAKSKKNYKKNSKKHYKRR